MFMLSLESTISENAFVRVIDAFVDAIDIKSFGFRHVECTEEGRPAYHPSALLKLYIYGYKFGIRSSRQLEREARLNMEAMWLLSGVHPRYHTISDFRKENKKAFREIFRRFVVLLREWELIEGETIAIDSFKIRAKNSLKNNYNEKKIERHIAYIDEKIAAYETLLDECDKEEERQELEEKIAYQNEKKDNYRSMEEKLQTSGEDQISLTDPDSKAVILLRNIVNVGYNVQASADAKNKLLVEFDTGHVNDTHALADMAISSKELLKAEKINAIADKGYHTGEEIQRCEDHNIITYVSPREYSTNNDELYPVEKFTYNKDNDTYTCPAECTLTTTGKWYKHSDRRKGRFSYQFKRYTTSKCKGCTQRQYCTGGKQNGRAIDRSQYAEALEENTRRVEQNPDYYRLRQQIIEHIFGTLKRQRGFTYTMVKGKENVLGEVGLMFIGYNLSRCVSILGIKKLIKALRECCLLIFRLGNRLILGHFEAIYLRNQKTVIC
jgi:Transposase and inactivated derivatives